MTDMVRIRPYRRQDRSAVRRICCDTALRGRPIEHLFPDRELVADMITRYYTDYEPRSSWVAERDGCVIGYLTGCLDSRRYFRVMAIQVVPRATLLAVNRGVLGYRETWRLIGAAIQTWWHGGLNRQVALDQYPAHLHINIQDGFRGQQVGPRLVQQFLHQANAARVPGVYASVRGDNLPACRFFERLGFMSLSRHPMVLPEGENFAAHETIVYGKRL